jgi:hypothetical protein
MRNSLDKFTTGTLQNKVDLSLQKSKASQVWWCTPVIPALGRLRQVDLGFKAQEFETLSQDKLKKKKGVKDVAQNPSPKRAGGVTQDAGPEFKLQYCKKKK